MPKYRFTHDFSGTINGSTERHALGDVIEIDYELAELLAVGDVELVEEPAATYEETDESVDVAETPQAPAHKTTRKVSRKKKG